jgi:pimeloyl-ACP methyl ester carboxylesterase/DNA-binding winged helix-turn-helix (wHTH) protein/class 3 adenylate cyclase
MKDSPEIIYGFGKFRVDVAERLLFDGKDTIALTPKAFDTLLFLIENCGHVLTKEEIMERVWADSFVEENNLAQNISLLRKSLGEGTGGAKYIETVSKRGYRFIAPVQVIENAGGDSISMQAIQAKSDFEEKRESGNGLTGVISETNRQQPNQTAHMLCKPETHYVQNGDVNIAYQTIGKGDLDIVFVMGWVSHLEYFWEEPHFAAFLNRLASFSRLILFDKRGTGLSDRVPIKDLPTLEQRMEDVHAVMNAVGSKHAVLIGVSEGGPMCSLFAATYPEKTDALVMIGTYAKRVKDDDYPWGVSKQDREAFFEMLRRNWGKPVGIEERAPSLAADENFRQWWATYLRMGASPGAAVALTKMNAEIDVREVLPLIGVPTLVIHRKGDMCLKVEEGRFVASLIPGCKYVELDGIDHLPFVGNQEEILDEIEGFLTGMRQSLKYDRVLATVMSIKIVSPQAEAEERGESDWLDLLERSRIYVQRQLQLFKGREVSYDENGVLAAFDGPARALRCALAITDSAKRLNVRVKTGVHTGECDVIGDRYGGAAVELAKKIAEESAPGEILASKTLKDLVAGSGIRFEERGSKSLRGIRGEWRLFHVLR